MVVGVSLGGSGGGESAPLIGTTEMGFSSAVGALGAVVVVVVVPVPVPLTWGLETAGSVSGAPISERSSPTVSLKFDCDRGARLPTAPKISAFTFTSRADADSNSGSGSRPGPGSGCTVTTGEPVSSSFDTSTVGWTKEVVGGGRGTRAACCVSASVECVECVEWAVGSLLLSRSIWGDGCVDVVSEVLGVRSAVMEREKSYGEREEVGEAHRILYHLRPPDPLTREHRPCPPPSPVNSSRYRAASCYGRPGPRAPVPIESQGNKTISIHN